MAITKMSNSGIATGGNLKYDDMLAGNPAYVPTTDAWDSIATATPSGGTASVSFSGIPQTYKHLQVRFNARASQAGSLIAVYGTINNDTNSNYAYMRLEFSPTVSAQVGASETSLFMAFFPGNSITSNYFGEGTLDIFDYADTSKRKTMLWSSGMGNDSGVARIQQMSLEWKSTAAVSSLQFPINNYDAGSVITLYGLKG